MSFGRPEQGSDDSACSHVGRSQGQGRGSRYCGLGPADLARGRPLPSCSMSGDRPEVHHQCLGAEDRAPRFISCSWGWILTGVDRRAATLGCSRSKHATSCRNPSVARAATGAAVAHSPASATPAPPPARLVHGPVARAESWLPLRFRSCASLVGPE